MDEAPSPLPVDDPTLTERLVLIVVGAHLRAEIEDRPTAYRLAATIDARAPLATRAVVCTDLWYLNDDRLRVKPTISVGGPDVNALSAFLANKVPSAFAIDGVLVVQHDVELLDLVACCWGVSPESTGAAVDAFCDRYLDRFLDEAARQWGA